MELFNLQSGSTLQEKGRGKNGRAEKAKKKKKKNQAETVCYFFRLEYVPHEILTPVYIQLAEKVNSLHRDANVLSDATTSGEVTVLTCICRLKWFGLVWRLTCIFQLNFRLLVQHIGHCLVLNPAVLCVIPQAKHYSGFIPHPSPFLFIYRADQRCYTV